MSAEFHLKFMDRGVMDMIMEAKQTYFLFIVKMGAIFHTIPKCEGIKTLASYPITLKRFHLQC